ncbi:DAO domain-containing protein [Cephalotus follicularis]|uniref:FAD-dependent oxidoreductase domain-containing protein 1 n=1 Tax=Cephalotus follicularis TaxID=3775 RepID=A0A1Q3C8W2_CEPFO|nr:DAO domain-containing protein [Cephalotus follicularis]
MASVSLYLPNSKLYFENGVAAHPNSSLSFKSMLPGYKRKRLSVRDRGTRPKPVHISNSIAAPSHTFDVVIIGAGIIGLTIARQFLLGSDLSVAVVDKHVPCSGATGAGQGYIWMVHMTPDSDLWYLTMRSHKLWEMLAESLRDQGLNPLQLLGWKKTGSLLVGRTPEESVMLHRRVEQLSEAGLRADYLSSDDLLLKEPELMVGRESGAAFLPDDCQIDAQRTVAYIEEANRNFAVEGRYAEFYNDPATCLLRSGSSGEIEGIQTSRNTLYSKKAVVVAAGCWSGSLMHELVKESNIALDVPVKPRKGHLLVIENFNYLHLNHGLMEVGYVDHLEALHPTDSALGMDDHAQTLSVSMTATVDSAGNLVLGSSRQFTGFNAEINELVVDRIWKRAGDFFPKLKELSLTDLRKSRKVRVGLRPYMPDGKPVIGPVPGLSNLYLATGHEGGGLSMALGTAEMVADMVMGNTGNADYATFAVQGRCC